MAPGVARAAITAGDTKEMAAEVIRLASGASLTDAVPDGFDRYLFTLTGHATMSGAGGSHRMEEEAFATIQEGTRFTIAHADGTPTVVVSVLAPPAQGGTRRPGFAGGMAV